MNYRENLIEQLNKIPGEPGLADLQKVTAQFFEEKLWVSGLGRKAFGWAIALAIISIALLCIPSDSLYKKIFDLTIYAAWTIFPPAFSMYEYTWKFPDPYKFDAMQFSDLKYKQELAAKIWGGLVLLITAILIYHYKCKIV